MDQSSIALGVMIVVTVLVLYRCTCRRRQERRRRNCSREGMKSLDRVNPSNVSHDKGARVSRELDKQYDALIDNEGVYKDYNAVIQRLALEPEVLESHANYAGDIGFSNNTASSMTIRSDPNDVNNWVLRPPVPIPVGEDARVDTSESTDQQRHRNRFLL